MNPSGMPPLRQPDSRDGKYELGGSLPEQVQDDLKPPDWLEPGEKKYFREVVSQQLLAGVGMRAVDAENYGRYVRYCFMARAESDPIQRLAIGRAINSLAMILCIGEYPRQRIGLRGKADPPPMPKSAAQKGKLAMMLAKKNGTER